MSEHASSVNMTSAQSALDELMAMVGVDGLIAAMQRPGLLAHIDQHVAAIRENLAGAGRPVDPMSLARYAASILLAASQRGCPLTRITTIDWRTADWYLLHLVAICALADAEDCF